MSILAVDPGVATGWAYWDGSSIFAAGEDEQMAFCGIARSFVWRMVPGDVIVCESYTITPQTLRKSRQYASLEIIGALRFMAHKDKLDFVLQSPADAKRFMTDSKLRALDWRRGGNGHTDDALRHLGLYLAKHEGNTEVLHAR